MTAEQAGVVLAHGVGGPTDLPVPLSFVLIGAAWALTFTFVVLVVALAGSPRFDPAKPGRPLPAWVTRAVDSPVVRWIARFWPLLFTVWVVVAAVFGPQDGENPLRGVVYVLLWVGLVAVSLAIGPVWRAISPVRTLYRLINAGRGTATGGQFSALRYPESCGYWPAAFGLLRSCGCNWRARILGHSRRPRSGFWAMSR